MTLWRWGALAGLVALAIASAFGRIAGLDACGTGGDPILEFEFVRSPAEVALLFPESCRAVAVAAQRKGLWLDALAFIPSYSAFLILSLMALQRESRETASRPAGAAILMTLAAALFDQFEGIQLFRLLADLPGTQPTIDLLMPAVRTKFGLLALAVAVAGWLHFRQPGWRKLLGAFIGLTALWAFAGLFVERSWLMQGSALSWLGLLAANILLSFRKSA